jgi:hypothetical protein
VFLNEFQTSSGNCDPVCRVDSDTINFMVAATVWLQTVVDARIADVRGDIVLDWDATARVVIELVE